MASLALYCTTNSGIVGESVCRLCFVSEDSRSLTDTSDVSLMIENIAGIKIPRDANEVLTVCGVCLSRLRVATKLKRQIEFTQTFIWNAKPADGPDPAAASPTAQELAEELDLHCHACNQQFPLFDMLLEHISNKHLEDSHSPNCSLCEALLAHQPAVDIIEMLEDEESAEQPEEEWQDNTERVNAENSRTPQKLPKIFDCHLCTKSYTSIKALRAHLGKMHNETQVPDIVEHSAEPLIILVGKDGPHNDPLHPYHCHLCDKSYSRKNKLKEHLAKIHEVFKMPRLSILAEFECSKCQKTYKSQENFDKHLREHDPRPFPCIFCADSFATRQDWRLHELVCIKLTVMGNGQHQCLVCRELHDSVDELRTHMRTGKCLPGEGDESGTPRHNCPACNETFSSIHLLVLHQESTHSVSVDCLACGKSFRNRFQLKKHSDRAHNEKQSLECGVCGQKLSRLDKLNEHMRLHKGFPCCDTVFATRKEYVHHRETTHRSAHGK